MSEVWTGKGRVAFGVDGKMRVILDLPSGSPHIRHGSDVIVNLAVDSLNDPEGYDKHWAADQVKRGRRVVCIEHHEWGVFKHNPGWAFEFSCRQGAFSHFDSRFDGCTFALADEVKLAGEQ